jgi:hypothetical protein
VPLLQAVIGLTTSVAKAKLSTQLLDAPPQSSVETLVFLMTTLLIHPGCGAPPQG